MSISFSADWKGLEDIQKNMAGLAIGMQEKVVLGGIVQAAEVYRQGIGRRAPSDTGHLAENIEATTRLTVVQGGAVAHIGPAKSAFYGAFLELGTRFIQARPFMRPTLVDDAPEAFQAFVRGARAAFLRLPGRHR